MFSAGLTSWITLVHGSYRPVSEVKVCAMTQNKADGILGGELLHGSLESAETIDLLTRCMP